jgi:hypothetical protein
MSMALIHWAMSHSSLQLKETRKKADFEAQLRLIQDFGVFHDFVETESGGP